MRIEAIILKKIPIQEYDQLIVCYCKHAGKQTYRAKSIKRHTSKQADHLDILNYVDFSLVCPKGLSREETVNGHSIVTSALSLRTFHNLKSSPKAMTVAFFILECFDKLVFEGASDEKLWNFLLNKLDELDGLAKQKNIRWPVVIESTRKALLKTMGHEPTAVIEDLAGRRFFSLQFAEKMLR